jgi:two-component system LytT family response regulator
VATEEAISDSLHKKPPDLYGWRFSSWHHIIHQMKGVEARLDPANFLRIHRSIIVAIDRIRSMEARDQGEYLVSLADGRQFVSSRSYSERVRALLR